MVVVKILSIIGFIVANVLSYLILKVFIKELSIFHFLFLLILSAIILRIDFSLWIYDSTKSELKMLRPSIISRGKKIIKKIKTSPYLIASILKNIIPIVRKAVHKVCIFKKKVFTTLNLFVLLRLLFFNTCYELFSVYILWLSLLGLVYLTGILEIQMTNTRFFFEAITVFGLFLGIFQFLLQRNEEKINVRINQNSQIIDSIIDDQTSFYRFYNSIPDADDRYNPLKNWISSQTDPKVKMLDLLKVVSENKQASQFMFRYISKQQVPFSINMASQDSNTKFQTLDIAAETNLSRKKDLHKVYVHFFTDEARIKEIIKAVDAELDMKEFRLIALSNINIIQEITPKFSEYSLRNLVGKLFEENENQNDVEEIEFSSYKEYKKYFRSNVYLRLLKQMLN